MLLNACKEICFVVNKGNIEYMAVGRHCGMIANEHIAVGSISYGKVKIFNQLRPAFTDK